ncbi:MAG: MinD/ParA family ATP-binding protein, partial [Longimicrobiales bacterium]
MNPAPWVLCAGKGGVGTTTLTALMGSEAGLEGARTLLVDGNFGAAGLHRTFGMMDGHRGLASLVDRSTTPEDLVLAVGPNLWLVPGGESPEGEPLLSPGQRAGTYRRLERIFADFDVVLIDGGSTLDSVLPSVQLDVAGVWTVSVGERIAMAGAYALLKVLTHSYAGTPVLPLFNRSGPQEAESLSQTMTGAALRFLRTRTLAPAYFPNVPELALDGKVTDVLMSDTARAALSALLPRLAQQTLR